MTTGPADHAPATWNAQHEDHVSDAADDVIFNNYASGLSLYYFVSNLLTIFLMLVIKNYIIDDQKIHAQIEENKRKPKNAGGFLHVCKKAIEQAEKQKKSPR